MLKWAEMVWEALLWPEMVWEVPKWPMVWEKKLSAKLFFAMNGQQNSPEIIWRPEMVWQAPTCARV